MFSGLAYNESKNRPLVCKWPVFAFLAAVDFSTVCNIGFCQSSWRAVKRNDYFSTYR